MNIQNVTCEFTHHPISLDCKNPRFSWEIAAKESDIFQTAWQIVVTDRNHRTMWDSGIQHSSMTTGISYQGRELQSASAYEYEITAWTNTGIEIHSDKHVFETAFFELSDWKAAWIEPDPLPQLPVNPLLSAQKEWGETLAAMMRGENAEMKLEGEILDALPLEPYDPAVQMRRTFTLDRRFIRARLYVTAHGIYEIKINGQPITDTWLNPGFTTYDKRLKYQVYNVDDFIQPGPNSISVTVADGWYKGKIALGRGCEYGEVPGLLLQMEFTDENGQKQILTSDESWKFSYQGPVRTADLFLGETYDARLVDGDPSSSSYDDSGWLPVHLQDVPGEVLEAQIHPPVRVFRELPALEILTAPNGDTLVDFGQNLAGVIRVRIQEPCGTEITFKHGETLDQDGNYFYCFAGTNKEQKDTYICGDSETEFFEPHFTYHGFRYVRVTGGTHWKKEDFTALALSTDNPVTGSFRCSDKTLNQLQSNIYWSQRSNNITIPTDCPTREKAGWTGDVVVYGATALFNQDMTAFYEDWLKSIRAEQRENGHILGTVPQIKNYVQQAFAGSLGWGDVILTLPMQLYQLCADQEVLSANYEAMGKWMDAMVLAADELPPASDTQSAECAGDEQRNSRSLENQHYLINTGFHFGDWIIPSVVNEEGFTDGPASAFLTMNYVGSSLLAADSDLYAAVSEILGYSENAEKYRNYAKRVRVAFEEEYVSPDGHLGQEMQGNYILALKHHMVSKEKEPLLARRLNELVVGNGFRLDTGFMSTPHILDILCQYGYEETAWKVLMQRECPSWLYEIEKGATTVWENWDAIRPDGKRAGCSFNHYAFGCVGDFLYRRVLGLKNAGIGYDKILIDPEYSCPLEWAEGSYHCAHGMIELRWEKHDNSIRISGKIPPNSSAMLRLPDGETKTLGNGKFEVETSF